MQAFACASSLRWTQVSPHPLSPRSCFRLQLSQEIKGLCFVFFSIATFEMTVKKEIRQLVWNVLGGTHQLTQPGFCLQSTYSAGLRLREQWWQPRPMLTQLINTPDKSMCTKYIPPWFTFWKHLEKRNIWNSNSTLKIFTRTSGASIASGDRRRHQPMSCGYSNSRADWLERFPVPPITWVGLCPSSRGRCQDGKNAPSTQQACCNFFFYLPIL